MHTRNFDTGDAEIMSQFSSELLGQEFACMRAIILYNVDLSHNLAYSLRMYLYMHVMWEDIILLYIYLTRALCNLKFWHGRCRNSEPILLELLGQEFACVRAIILYNVDLSHNLAYSLRMYLYTHVMWEDIILLYTFTWLAPSATWNHHRSPDAIYRRYHVTFVWSVRWRAEATNAVLPFPASSSSTRPLLFPVNLTAFPCQVDKIWTFYIPDTTTCLFLFESGVSHMPGIKHTYLAQG